MTIKLDVSASSVVITCTDCPYWYSFRFDRLAGYRAGEAHAVRVHEIEPNVAATARRLWERRHADD